MKKALKIYISVDMEGMAGITSPSHRNVMRFLPSAALYTIRYAGSSKEFMLPPEMMKSGKSPFLILTEAERTFLMMNFARWMNVSA